MRRAFVGLLSSLAAPVTMTLLMSASAEVTAPVWSWSKPRPLV